MDSVFAFDRRDDMMIVYSLLYPVRMMNSEREGRDGRMMSVVMTSRGLFSEETQHSQQTEMTIIIKT